MSVLKKSLSVLFISFSILSIAQPVEGTLNWYNKEDQGMFTEKAYKFLKKKKSKTVIVGVIDSGVDIEHEDLKGQIWINEGEIAGNGIDDDNNGYIDDVHGWNFLGNEKGEHVNEARLEKTQNPGSFRQSMMELIQIHSARSKSISFILKLKKR